MKILILNGPNLNLLGQREPDIYGTLTLDALNRELELYAKRLGEQRLEGAMEAKGVDDAEDAKVAEAIELFFYQSNHEGILVDTIQNAPRAYAGIVYNPAAHTHYSIALRDAIAAIPIPVVEVHLSDIKAREPFRSVSVMTDVCLAQYSGKGVDSYKEALATLVAHLEKL